MGAITMQHLDDSELTDEELRYWGPLVQKSLYEDYLAKLLSLHDSESYNREGADQTALKEEAWAETIATNAVCKEISLISAQRRLERMLCDGSFAQCEPSRQLSIDEVEALLRNFHPEGELCSFDGTPVDRETLEAITALVNNRAERQQMLAQQAGTAEADSIIGNILARIRERWGSFFPGRSRDQSTCSALVQLAASAGSSRPEQLSL